MRPHGLWPARLLCRWNYPGKNTGVGCHFLLSGIFLIQGSNPCLLHWQAGSLPLHLHLLESPLIHLSGIKPIPPALESRSLSVVVVFFIFRCSRSSLLWRRFSLCVVVGGYSSLQCSGFSLWWLCLLRSVLSTAPRV